MDKNDLKLTAESLMEKTATPEELIDFNYRSLLTEVSVLVHRAQHCNIDLMQAHQIKGILDRVKGLSERKDVRANLCKQISPAGSRRRP